MASVAPFVKRFAFSLSSQARSRDLVDVHVSFRYRPQMPNEKLKPAEPSDIAQSIAFALCYSGRKRVHDLETFTARIAADRIVRHLERCGFVVMKRPPSVGAGDNPGRRGGFEG